MILYYKSQWFCITMILYYKSQYKITMILYHNDFVLQWFCIINHNTTNISEYSLYSEIFVVFAIFAIFGNIFIKKFLCFKQVT